MTPSDPLLDVLDDARRSQAVRARQRERSLRGQVEEDATLVGTLLDLAERSTLVTVGTTTGRRHAGALNAVGIDWCAVRGDERASTTFLRLSSISTVRPGGTGRTWPVASGDRTAPVDLLLADLLARWAAERSEVLLVVTTGELLTGELRGAGLDIVTLKLEGAGDHAYVALSSISEVSGRRSG